MSTDLAVALVIPWVFWGVLMALLIAAGRSWINLLPIPVGITAVLLVIAGVSAAQDAFWASVVAHLLLLVLFLGSYLAFVIREWRRTKR